MLLYMFELVIQDKTQDTNCDVLEKKSKSNESSKIIHLFTFLPFYPNLNVIAYNNKWFILQTLQVLSSDKYEDV